MIQERLSNQFFQWTLPFHLMHSYTISPAHGKRPLSGYTLHDCLLMCFHGAAAGNFAWAIWIISWGQQRALWQESESYLYTHCCLCVLWTSVICGGCHCNMYSTIRTYGILFTQILILYQRRISCFAKVSHWLGTDSTTHRMSLDINSKLILK